MEHTQQRSLNNDCILPHTPFTIQIYDSTDFYVMLL